MILTCGSWAENKRLSGGWDTEFTQMAIPYWINLVCFNLLNMYRAYTVCKMWCRTSGFGDGIPQLLSSLRFCSLRAEIIIQLTCEKKKSPLRAQRVESVQVCVCWWPSGCWKGWKWPSLADVKMWSLLNYIDLVVDYHLYNRKMNFLT